MAITGPLFKLTIFCRPKLACRLYCTVTGTTNKPVFLLSKNVSGSITGVASTKSLSPVPTVYSVHVPPGAVFSAVIMVSVNSGSTADTVRFRNSDEGD